MPISVGASGGGADLSNFVSVVVGAALATGGAFVLDWFKRRHERRNITVALGGEVAAVAEVVRRRQWLNQIADFAAQATEHDHVQQFEVHLPPEFVPTCRLAMQHAGLLRGSLPRLLPRFVMLADGIASDIRRLAEYPPGAPKSFLDPANPEGAAMVYTELFGVMLNALQIADEIVAEVNRQYPGVELITGPSDVEVMIAMAARQQATAEARAAAERDGLP